MAGKCAPMNVVDHKTYSGLTAGDATRRDNVGGQVRGSDALQTVQLLTVTPYSTVHAPARVRIALQPASSGSSLGYHYLIFLNLLYDTLI